MMSLLYTHDTMPVKIAEKKYFKPGSVKEAIEAASECSDNFKFIAGGTDVMVNKFQGNDNAKLFIDITGIDELKTIHRDENFVYIGALTKLDDLKKSEIIRNEFPTLIEAAHAVASPLIRKTATIGGNVLCENRCIYYNQSEWWREAIGRCLKCNGDVCIATGGKKACFSEFASDTAPVLISMNAGINLAEQDGERVLPLEEIYTGDGVKPKNIKNTSLLREIILPLGQDYKCVFKKLRQRESLEFTSLTTAVSVNNQNKLRIVLAGVDPKPVLIEAGTNDDKDELIKIAIKKARVVENDMFSRTYRREMIKVYLKSSFENIGL